MIKQLIMAAVAVALITVAAFSVIESMSPEEQAMHEIQVNKVDGAADAKDEGAASKQ